ncbi:uncharacterized protein LOC144730765 isoform X1 [Lampetra planeri]
MMKKRREMREEETRPSELLSSERGEGQGATMTTPSLPPLLLLGCLFIQMLCVGGTPVTAPPCTQPGPWGIRCLPGCFLEEESGTCAPCPRGSFMDHINTKHKCLRCRSCNAAEAGFEEGRPCSAQADAECHCRPGLHCVTPDCPLCQGQPLCPPGQQPGPPPGAQLLHALPTRLLLRLHVRHAALQGAHAL